MSQISAETSLAEQAERPQAGRDNEVMSGKSSGQGQNGSGPIVIADQISQDISFR